MLLAISGMGSFGISNKWTGVFTKVDAPKVLEFRIRSPGSRHHHRHLGGVPGGTRYTCNVTGEPTQGASIGRLIDAMLSRAMKRTMTKRRAKLPAHVDAWARSTRSTDKIAEVRKSRSRPLSDSVRVIVVRHRHHIRRCYRPGPRPIGIDMAPVTRLGLTTHLPSANRPIDTAAEVRDGPRTVGELLGDRTAQVRQCVCRHPERVLELIGRYREEMRPHPQLGVEGWQHSRLDFEKFVHPRPTFAGRRQGCAAFDAETSSQRITPSSVTLLDVVRELGRIPLPCNVSRAARVPPVTNRTGLDTGPVVNDVVDHPELTSPRCIGSGQFILKRFTDTPWIVGQRSRDELEKGRGKRLRKFFGQSPPRSRRENHFISHPGNRPLARISFVASSRVWKSPRVTTSAVMNAVRPFQSWVSSVRQFLALACVSS